MKGGELRGFLLLQCNRKLSVALIGFNINLRQNNSGTMQYKVFLFLTALLLSVTGTRGAVYFTAQNGDFYDSTTWVAGNNPAIPDMTDSTNFIFIQDSVFLPGSVQVFPVCFIRIENTGCLITNCMIRITSACHMEVWGSLIIHNNLVMDGGLLQVFYNGLVEVDNKVTNNENGLIQLFGGSICYANLWKGPDPEGEGVYLYASGSKQCYGTSGQSTSTVYGRLVYDNALSTPLHCCKLYLIDHTGLVSDSCLTDPNGNFLFLNIDTGSYSIAVSTSNPPGGVNSIDALLALQHFTGLIELTGLRFVTADVNQSGYINSLDAFLILKRFLQLIPTFPAGDWIFEESGASFQIPAVTVSNFKGLSAGDVNGSYIPPACGY